MSDAHDAFDPTIAGYYSQGKEAQRLHRGKSQLERLRTQELLLRFLPPAPAVIHDVGGGAGIYALWLARHGYTVHLLDAMPLHVEQARQASVLQPDAPIETVTLGDARDLPFADESADAVLLFGPLYHLTERRDRLTALAEVLRTLKPGGLLLAVGINRFASTFDGLFEGLFADPDFVTIAAQDLRDGQHRDPKGQGYFTTAFFHHSEELRTEVAEAGLVVESMLGIEGAAWLLDDFDAAWSDPQRREWMMQVSRQLEGEPTLLGVSAHVMVVGRKKQ